MAGNGIIYGAIILNFKTLELIYPLIPSFKGDIV